MKLVPAPALLALSLCFVAPAQTTWVVDAARGLGSQFTDIQAAIDAASTGDTIRVRYGVYRGFWIDGKGLAVLGETDRVVVSSSVAVENVPAAAATSLYNLRILPGTLWVDDNAGGVHVDAVVVGRGTRVTNSTHVTFRGCTMLDAAILVASNVQVAQSSIVSQPRFLSATGVEVSGGTVAIQGCQIRGGPAGSHPSLMIGSDAGPALDVYAGGAVTVTGRSILMAGPELSVPVIQTESGGLVTVGIRVALIPNPGGVTHVGQVVRYPSTSVEVYKARASGPLLGVTIASPLSNVGVLVGLPAAPQTTALGDLWLAPPAILIDHGTTDASGLRPFRVPLSAGVPPGLAITFQAYSLATGTPRLSTPTTLVLGL